MPATRSARAHVARAAPPNPPVPQGNQNRAHSRRAQRDVTLNPPAPQGNQGCARDNRRNHGQHQRSPSADSCSGSEDPPEKENGQPPLLDRMTDGIRLTDITAYQGMKIKKTEQLNAEGENYESWQSLNLIILDSRAVKGVVTGLEKVENLESPLEIALWHTKDKYAKAQLSLNIVPHVLATLKFDHSHELWELLQSRYKKNTAEFQVVIQDMLR